MKKRLREEHSNQIIAQIKTMMVSWIRILKVLSNFESPAKFWWQIPYQPTHVVEQFPLPNLGHKCSSQAIDYAPAFLSIHETRIATHIFWQKLHVPCRRARHTGERKAPIAAFQEYRHRVPGFRLCVDVCGPSMRTSNDQSSIAVLLSHTKHPVNSQTAAKTNHHGDDNHKYIKTQKRMVY